MKTDYIKIIKQSLLSLILIGGLLSGCGGAVAPENPEATEQETSVAQETSTTVEASATSTSTPKPTNTPTPVPSPTEGVPPTFTPTSTPTPTNTPTPAPPTSTPYPTQPPATNTPTPTPDLAAEAYQQGRAYFDQGLWAEAIPEFQRAIELNPEFAPAYRDLGNSYFGQEQFEQAVQPLETYLTLAPDDDPERDFVEERLAQIADDPRIKWGITDLPEIPEGQAMFLLINRGGENWVIDVGPYTFEIPRAMVEYEPTYYPLIVEPGSYTWAGHTVDNPPKILIGPNGWERSFDFTVPEGEIHIETIN